MIRIDAIGLATMTLAGMCAARLPAASGKESAP
jgi:hypothetical protein